MPKWMERILLMPCYRPGRSWRTKARRRSCAGPCRLPGALQGRVIHIALGAAGHARRIGLAPGMIDLLEEAPAGIVHPLRIAAGPVHGRHDDPVGQPQRSQFDRRE